VQSFSPQIKQQHDGHILPTFLDPTLKKLLYGCLHDNPALRLTAKECNYLLNIETASNEEERIKIHSAISDGCKFFVFQPFVFFMHFMCTIIIIRFYFHFQFLFQMPRPPHLFWSRSIPTNHALTSTSGQTRYAMFLYQITWHPGKVTWPAEWPWAVVG